MEEKTVTEKPRLRAGFFLRAWSWVWGQFRPGKWAPGTPKYWINLWDAQMIHPGLRTPYQKRLIQEREDLIFDKSEKEL